MCRDSQGKTRDSPHVSISIPAPAPQKIAARDRASNPPADPPQLPAHQSFATLTHRGPANPHAMTKPRGTSVSQSEPTTRADVSRANAQYSTGPKSAEGKRRSALNALRHGLTGQIVVMPSEDLAAYRRHVQNFTDEYHPNGATEAQLVQSLADASWRLNRIAALEANVLALSVQGSDEIQDALAIAAAFGQQSKALANLSLHTQRLSRQFERTVTQLRELQQTRQAKEEQEMEHLLNILEAHERHGEEYNPSEDGFVFSEPQIHHARQARNRSNQSNEALRSAA